MPYRPEDDEIPNPLRPGLRAESAPEPCAVVVFGASGDLAHRKLIPALYNLAVGAHLPAAFGVVGVAKSEYSDDQFRADMREAVGKFSRTKPIDEDIWADFAAGLRYSPGSFDDPQTFIRLKGKLEELDRARATRGNRLFYFATPPSTFPTLLTQLKSAGLINPPSTAQRWRIASVRRNSSVSRAAPCIVLERSVLKPVANISGRTMSEPSAGGDAASRRSTFAKLLAPATPAVRSFSHVLG